MQNIFKNTKLCISISSIPGNFGNKFHNFFYKKKKLNYIYMSRKMRNIKNLKKILIDLKIVGCSVSMPFKKEVYKIIDQKDDIVKKTKISNTILNKDGKLYGFNTDYYSIQKTINNLKLNKNSTVLILGSGSMAYLSFHHIKKKTRKVFIVARNKRKLRKWFPKIFTILDWGTITKKEFDLIINATSLGMSNEKIEIISKKNFKKNSVIIDFVINSKNELKKIAENLKIKYISGFELTLLQAAKQFKIYTGRNINKKDLDIFKIYEKEK